MARFLFWFGLAVFIGALAVILATRPHVKNIPELPEPRPAVVAPQPEPEAVEEEKAVKPPAPPPEAEPVAPVAEQPAEPPPPPSQTAPEIRKPVTRPAPAKSAARDDVALVELRGKLDAAKAEQQEVEARLFVLQNDADRLQKKLAALDTMQRQAQDDLRKAKSFVAMDYNARGTYDAKHNKMDRIQSALDKIGADYDATAAELKTANSALSKAKSELNSKKYAVNALEGKVRTKEKARE